MGRFSQDGHTNSTFNGNGFRIDGNDHLLAGGLANPNHPIPGISTRNDTNSSGGMTLPTPVQVTSLIDCSQAVAGTSGCP